MVKWRFLVCASLAATTLSIAAPPAFSQTAIVISGYGTLNRTATGCPYCTEQVPANQAGGFIEMQHLSGPFLGFEATYSYNRANTTYSNAFPSSNVPGFIPALGCPSAYGCPRETVSANAHDFTADWTPSRLISKQRLLLFGVLGGGILADVPSNSKATVVTKYPCGIPVSTGGGVYVVCPGTPATVISTDDTRVAFKPVYVYGGGLDWGLFSHLGMRLQYRGNFYSAPNMTKLFSPTDAYTHTAGPMIGIYLVL